MKNYDKSKLRSALLHWISAGCFIIATALSAATYIMSLPEIRARLFKLLSYFDILSKSSMRKTFTLPYNYTDLADFLSVDRSAMMRELSHLKEEGFIDKKGNKIKLLY